MSLGLLDGQQAMVVDQEEAGPSQLAVPRGERKPRAVEDDLQEEVVVLVMLRGDQRAKEGPRAELLEVPK